MEVKEAADLLDNLIGMIEDSGGRDYDTALKMGIEALTSKPTDCISRQAAITLPVMPKEHREYQTCNLDDTYEQGWNDLQKCIELLPSAQPEPQWIPCSEPPTEHGFYHEILLYGKDGNYAVGWYDEDYFTWDDRFGMDTPVAWCKLPEPWRGEETCTKNAK